MRKLIHAPLTLAIIVMALGGAFSIATPGSSSRTQAINRTSASGRIRGVLYTARGETASGATVIISRLDGRKQDVTKTNAEGRFMFSGLPAGSYVMQGCAEEFGPSDPADVELKAGADATQDLKMNTGFVKTAEPSCAIDAIIQPPVSTADVAVARRRTRDEYTGQIMSIDLQGSLREFLQSIASISGLDVIMDPSIDRNITVHLKDVPWDLALDVVRFRSPKRSCRSGWCFVSCKTTLRSKTTSAPSVPREDLLCLTYRNV